MVDLSRKKKSKQQKNVMDSIELEFTMHPFILLYIAMFTSLFPPLWNSLNFYSYTWVGRWLCQSIKKSRTHILELIVKAQGKSFPCTVVPHCLLKTHLIIVLIIVLSYSTVRLGKLNFKLVFLVLASVLPLLPFLLYICIVLQDNNIRVIYNKIIPHNGHRPHCGGVTWQCTAKAGGGATIVCRKCWHNIFALHM